MDDKLSWDNIKERYPDEWIILVDVDVDQSTNVTGGRIFDHSPSKRAMHERLKDARREVPGGAAILCTRPLRGGIIASLGFAKLVVGE